MLHFEVEPRKSDVSDKWDKIAHRASGTAPRRGAFFIAQVSEGRSPDEDPGKA